MCAHSWGLMFRNACVATVGLILALALCRPAAAGNAAQAGRSAADVAQTGEAVTLEPIECWSRTSASAARVGELFTLVLTCSVVETASTTVVPDQSRLDPGALQILPFEVVRGTQAADVRTGTHRFFQYEYTLRYVGEDFGKDLTLSPVTITYRVQSRVQQDAAVEGRERRYILPARTIRILSLVPATATDIRDQPAETFSQITARRFSANVFRVIAGSLYVFGALVVVSGLTRAFRGRQRLAPAVARLASDSAILRRVSEELGEVRRLRAVEGWTDALAARALGPLRVVASYAVSLPVAHVRGRGMHPSDGQLVVPGRWPGRNATLVSASATSVTLAEARPDLDAAVSRFSGKAYGRDAGAVNDADLDGALDVGARELGRLRREQTWLARKRRALVSRLGRRKPDTTGGVS